MPATGRLHRHAGVHERQRRGAHRRHRGRAVRRQHLGHEPQRVGELLLARHHGQHGPLGQRAVTDLAALGRADPARPHRWPTAPCCSGGCSAWWSPATGVHQLVHAGHGQRADVEHLGLAPLEQARAVRGGQHAHLGRHRPQVGRAPRPSMRTPSSTTRLRTSFLVSERMASLISFSRPANAPGSSLVPASSARTSSLTVSVAALRSALAEMVTALASLGVASLSTASRRRRRSRASA